MENSKFEIRNSKYLTRGTRALSGFRFFHPRHPRFASFEFLISNFEFNP